MLCSNCGKDVPFAGKVCPWCGIDKSKDQEQHTMMMVFGTIGLVLGGYFGYLFSFLWAVGGCLLGCFAGVGIGIYVANDNNKRRGR